MNALTDYATTEPKTFRKGDTVIWKRTDIDSDYDTSTHSVVFSARLQSNGSTTFTTTATESGNDYIFTLDNSNTASYTTGIYTWAIRVTQTSDSETITIDEGTIEVKDNLFADTGDTRSHAKKMLDKIESVLENRADADVMSYSIAGRSLAKMSPQELVEWRDYYRREYNKEIKKERIKNGEGSGNLIKARFGQTDPHREYFDRF